MEGKREKWIGKKGNWERGNNENWGKRDDVDDREWGIEKKDEWRRKYGDLRKRGGDWGIEERMGCERKGGNRIWKCERKEDWGIEEGDEKEISGWKFSEWMEECER